MPSYYGMRAVLGRVKTGECSPFGQDHHPSVHRWLQSLFRAGPSVRLIRLAEQAAQHDLDHISDPFHTSVLNQLIKNTLKSRSFNRMPLRKRTLPNCPLADYHAALDSAAATLVAAGHPDGLRLLARLAALR
jgi:hypothetical protein